MNNMPLPYLFYSSIKQAYSIYVNMRKIVFLMADNWACGLYRCYMPALWMNKTNMAEAYCSFHGAKIGRIPLDYSLFNNFLLANTAGLLGNELYVSPEELRDEYSGV